MYTKLLVKILSSHRQPGCTAYPHPLALRTITTIVNHSLSPNQNLISAGQIQSDLQELQAQGEVVSGSGNRFCIAPPTVFTKQETHLTGVRFVGDRAYLRRAHQALKTGQVSTKTMLHPETQVFYRIKERLESHGIRCQSINSSVENLPRLEPPRAFKLQGQEWTESPFLDSKELQQYIPSANSDQNDRWYAASIDRLEENLLIRLPTSEYLWYTEGQFYEVSPDTATLTMFWLDKQRNLPISVMWDEAIGRLNLQGISLPTAYAQKLWWLSQPDDTARVRRFKADQRPIVRHLFARLGCQLI